MIGRHVVEGARPGRRTDLQVVIDVHAAQGLAGIADRKADLDRVAVQGVVDGVVDRLYVRTGVEATPAGKGKELVEHDRSPARIARVIENRGQGPRPVIASG